MPDGGSTPSTDRSYRWAGSAVAGLSDRQTVTTLVHTTQQADTPASGPCALCGGRIPHPSHFTFVVKDASKCMIDVHRTVL